MVVEKGQLATCEIIQPMSIPIRLPNLGSSDESIRISCWLVDSGDFVEEGDRLVEVLMPGTTFDVQAPAPGIVGRIERTVDAVVAVGDVLGWIEECNQEAD